MDVYSLINSKAIAEYCKKIKHEFNIEEIAILISRCKSLDIENKIKFYNEALELLKDMPMIKHIHCGPYDSVKEVIKKEIERIKKVKSKFITNEENYYYVFNPYYSSSGKMERNYCENMRKTYNEMQDLIKQYLKDNEEYNKLAEFEVKKKLYKEEYEITAKYYVKDNQAIMTDIYDTDEEYPDISTIFLWLPLPFKKGDLLCSNTNHPFDHGYIPRDENVFVLEWVITEEEKLKQGLSKGNCDESDMYGYGYYIYENNIEHDTVWQYDNWEYYRGKLSGTQRILNGVSNLLKGNICLDLFLRVYNVIKEESISPSLA